MTNKRFEKIIRLCGRIIFFYLLTLQVPVKAQQYYFDNYSIAEGLAQSKVYSIIQDSEDNFWLGTQAGVSWFDGVEFQNLTAEDGLAQGGVRAIIEDSHGAIWMGHEGGRVTRYRNNGFEIFKAIEDDINNVVTSIVEDTEGNLWITSEGSGAAMIKNPEAQIDSLHYEMFLGRRLSDRIFGNLLTEDGTLYLITDVGVKFFNSDSMRFENFSVNNMPRYFATTTIFKDSENNFWFGTYKGGLYKYDPLVDDTKMYDLIQLGMTTNWVSALFEDRYGNIWIGTYGGGVGRLDTEDNLTVFDNRNGMPGSKIWNIMEDREGNIVIGTSEHGMCAFKGDYFISWFENDGLVNSQVWAIAQDDDRNYWMGTNAGISIMEDPMEPGSVKTLNRYQDKQVRFIEKDHNGNIWIAIEGEGLFTYLKNGRYYFEPRINTYISLNTVTALCVDGLNNLWVGTLDGLLYYEIDNRQMNFITQITGLSGNSISALFPDSKNRIWVGIQGKGINFIEGTEFNTPDLGIAFTPTCFTEDDNGIIWIGTEGRGVIAYDPEKDTIIDQLTVDDGLLANLINLLNYDNNNNIYIGTNKGLNKYDRAADKIFGFTKKSGFVGIETKKNATYLDHEGNIWFGTGNGVTRYNPSLKPRDVMEPLTHITGLKVNYETYPMEEGMKLSYRQNSLIFDYRCITLNPEAVKYQIMLEGIDSDWRPSSDQTQVNYPALPPRKYTFYVKAKNSDGVWNDPPVSLSFQIKPPFYKTWYFILSCIVALGFIIFTYIKVRERALVRENRILEDKVRLRTQEVVAQKEELAQKNKDITDSIKYAKRIQFAILPPISPFPDTFILFKPKDIVSGDFYWFTDVEGKEFIAAVDCTGHGVPGALMSIIGHNSLNKIVNQYGIMEPGKILTELNREVVETLHHTSEDGEVNDGMDLSLISFNREEQALEYAGAYNSIYLVRDGELIEYKADRQPIGRSAGKNKVFNTQKIGIRKEDMVYMFSDGYADQFGGEKLKKFKSKNMKELMVSISNEKVDSQRKILDNSIEKWRGDVEQIDDILVIGRKF
ncbi:MAG: SpoIIE family protein phosphatase [Bacteroidales bacterium]|nr:SpoIIE family protein phosphatase [Bacteroidales bacterium]